MRLVWKQFVPWLTVNHADKVGKLRVLQVKVSDMVSEVELRQCESILNSDPFKEIHLIWMQYLQYLRSEKGPLSCFWMSYIGIVGDVLLGLIRASREGNWQLHLYAIHNMILWCFAYDKINYARYLPVYYAQMINLPSQHRNVYSNFMNGRFSVKLAGESPFWRIPVDQTTEVTVNKDTKSSGGITKYSLTTGAVTRFYMTAEYRYSFLVHLRDMVQVKRPSYHHDEMLSTRKRKDEQAVTTIDVKGAVQRTGREICESLIGLHSFTGCDSVSAFAGKGKIGALKILKSNEGTRRAFRELGQSWTVSEDL